jgi:hypothetical protein
MSDIAKEVRKQINKPTAKLLFYLANDDSCSLIRETDKASDVHEDLLLKSVQVRELEDAE